MRRALLDENISQRIGAALQEAGWDVVFTSANAAGAADIDVLAESVRGRQVLVTRDRDYGELVFRARRTAFGVLYIRLRPDEQTEARVAEAMAGSEGAYVTLDNRGVRRRALPGS